METPSSIWLFVSKFYKRCGKLKKSNFLCTIELYFQTACKAVEFILRVTGKPNEKY